MKIEWAVLAGAALIAASNLFVGRWQIAAVGYGYSGGQTAGDTDTEIVYRLDRWSGQIQQCSIAQNLMPETDLLEKWQKEGAETLSCAPIPPPPKSPN